MAVTSMLDQKVREYKELLDRREELEKQMKANQQQLKDMEQNIARMMIDEEKPNTIVDGFVYSLQQKTVYSKKSEEVLIEAGITFFDVLREQGLGDIIVEKVDSRTLQSTIKAIVEEQGELPKELAESINVYEQLGIGKRKADTKVLDRAKANREV